MGTCTCWQSLPKDLTVGQGNAKMMQTSPVQIPSMHPKVYALAEKVFAHKSELIETVDLKDREIGDDGGRYLSAILPYLSRLIYLNLQFTNISLAVWEQILSSIEEVTSLRHIDLSRNQFNEKNVEQISVGIQKNLQLEVVILDSTGITSTGMSCLCESIAKLSSLKILALHNNSIGDFGVMSLANTIAHTPNLQYLDISKNNFSHSSSPYLASVLPQLLDLKVFKIGDNCVKDEGFIAIIKTVCHNIEELAFNNIGISSQGLKELCGVLRELKKLNYLHLDYNNISQNASKMLIDILPDLNIKYLSLVGCEVSNHRKALSLAQNCTEVLI